MGKGCCQRLRVCLAAGFMLAAGCRTIRPVYQNIIMAGCADQAINRLAKLLMTSFSDVFGASLFAAHSHFYRSSHT